MQDAGSVGRLTEKAMLLCASGALFALVASITISYGLKAVAECEVNTYRLLHQSPGVIFEIAAANGCGF